MILLTWQKIPQVWKWISTSWSGLSIHFAHGCKILHAKGWSQKSTTLKAEPLTMSSLYFFLSPWWRSLSWLAISLYWSLSCWQVSSSLERMRRASFLLSNFRLHTKNLSKQCTRAMVLWDILLLTELAVMFISGTTAGHVTSVLSLFLVLSCIFMFILFCDGNGYINCANKTNPNLFPTGGKTHWSEVFDVQIRPTIMNSGDR